MTRIQIKVIPKSSRQDLKMEGKTLKVWLHAPPEKGKANQELVLILAKKLHIPKSSIQIIKGESTKNKLVDIEGITLEEIQKIA